MGKTVCIMTSEESFHNNYGAVLQGYALFHEIQKKGYNPKIVRYRGGMHLRKKDMSFYLRNYQRIRTIGIILISKFYSLFKSKKQKARSKQIKKYRAQIFERESLFLSFQNSNMKFYNSKRIGWYDLKEFTPLADIYLCGSDQIWNPYFKSGRNDLAYFLDFAPIGKKRIAYAPSFGCSELPEKAKSNIADLLSKFDFISVREKEGAKIVFDAIGKEVPVVADPTLLFTHTQWISISTLPNNVPKDYILCYRFSDNIQTKKSIDAISDLTGLPVVSLPLSKVAMQDNYLKIFNAGPSDFVGLIKNAKLVCTDSFHAVVFSLIFNVPFYVFPRENFSGVSANMNSRIINILRLSNLQKRFISDVSNINVEDIFSIDFQHSNSSISDLRKFSLEWLEKALKS
jgi:hypothetical protein